MDSFEQPGTIFASIDPEFRWFEIPNSPRGYWVGMASAADLSVLVAAQDMDANGDPGSILVSTDYAESWYASAPPAYWSGAAASGNTIQISEYHEAPKPCTWWLSIQWPLSIKC